MINGDRKIQRQSKINSKMITVIGSNGQLGWELVRQGKQQGYDVLAMDYPDIDITDPGSIKDRISTKETECIINAAAYTAVDKAESEPKKAFAVNGDGPEYLARQCEDLGLPLVHISTDYVFDGTQTTGYSEQDPISPLGAYGESKAAGEESVREFSTKHIILRTAWLYGVHGQNFVKTILALMRNRSVVKVVADQYGCPTYAADLADAILSVTAKIIADKSTSWGTYHYCGSGKTSWYGFAQAIKLFSSQYERLTLGELVPIKTVEYPLPAKRPANAVLDCHKIMKEFNIKTRPWKVSLEQMISALYA